MGQLEDILKHQTVVRNTIMKSFGAETSEDSLEKSFEDEVNPFEMEAYKSELTKAELDEFEKAKHQDGDMHPNGKWVWRQSANGGKGKNLAGKLLSSMKEYGYSHVSGTMLANGMTTFKFYNKDADKNITMVPYQDALVIKTSDKREALEVSNFKTIEDFKKKFDETVLKLAGKNDDKKKSEKSSFESKEADAYDKGDGKVGNYPVPTHTSYPAANLYSRLKNNRHFGFKYGLPEEEIMKKLKDYKGNVKVSYHNNAGTSEIYRIKLL